MDTYCFVPSFRKAKLRGVPLRAIIKFGLLRVKRGCGTLNRGR